MRSKNEEKGKPDESQALEADEILLGTEEVTALLGQIKANQAERKGRPTALPSMQGPKGRGAVAPPLASCTKTTPKFLSLFYVGEEESRTHAFKLLDGVPAYDYSRRKPVPVPGEKEIRPKVRKFDFEKKVFTYTMFPVWIRDVSKGAKADDWRQEYPGEREEFVYEGLKRLASMKKMVLLDGDAGFTFSLSELRDLLSKVGHTYAISKIRKSIEMLQGAKFEIADPSRENVVLDTMLGTVAFNGRGEKQKCYVKFSQLTTEAMKTLSYRDMDWKVCMSLKEPTARRLYGRMCLYFKQASPSIAYTVLASSILQNTGLAAVGAPARWAKTAFEGIHELETRGQVREVKKEAVKDESGRVKDFKFHLFPSLELFRFILHSNERDKDRQRALASDPDSSKT